MDKNRIYTVKEVARLLGFSTNTVYKYLDEGKIKATRLGKEGRFRIPQKEVAKLLGVEEVMPTEALPPELTPEATSEVVPNAILTVKLEDASSIVNIREEPSTDSAKLGKALYGDTFEFVSKDQGWYEIRLDNGLTGFISEKYIIEKGANN